MKKVSGFGQEVQYLYMYMFINSNTSSPRSHKPETIFGLG